MFSFETTKLVRKNRPTTRLWLEALEDRTLPSVSTLPLSVASPPAVPQNAAVTSFAASIMDQWSYLIATIQQDVIGAYQALGQQIAQEASAVQLQRDRFLGISPSTANPSAAAAVPQPATPSATTTGHAPAQTPHSVQSPKGTYAVQTANYLWDPPNPANDDNASTAGNWWYEGKRAAAKPGTNAGEAVVFDPGDSLIKDGNGNAPIIWDYNPMNKLTQMNMGPVAAYTGQQTINSGINVELTGVDALGDPAPSLQMLNTNSSLTLRFSTTDSIFQVDGDATITNMDLSSPGGAGQFIINGGTTTMAQPSGFTEKLGVQMLINPGATVQYLSNNSLQITADIIDIIHIKGVMNFFWGQIGTGITLVDGGAANPDDFIWVDGGVLAYYGRQNRTDTITLPIAVTNGGDFNLTQDPNSDKPFAGKLIVQNGNSSTNDVSVWLKDSPSVVTLINFATLECDNGYWEDGGVLETLDDSTCNLQVGNDGKGTATIAGGWVAINATGQKSPFVPGTGYGTLSVSAATLNFNGTLFVAVEGAPVNPKFDTLNVTGTTNLQAASILTVDYTGGGGTWYIIQDAGGAITGNFAVITTVGGGPSVTGQIDPDDPNLYEAYQGGQ